MNIPDGIVTYIELGQFDPVTGNWFSWIHFSQGGMLRWEMNFDAQEAHGIRFPSKPHYVQSAARQNIEAILNHARRQL